jgi:hypothetical protein
MYRQTCFLICSLFLFSVGCGQGKIAERISEMNSTPIKKLITCYSFYQSRNNFRGPKDEAALRKFIADEKNQKGFERAGIDTSDIDALFISDSDGEPFKIKYGVPGSPMGFVEALIFESVGVDGEVMVGFGGATTELMSAEESEKLFKSRKRAKVKRLDDRPEDMGTEEG